MATTKTPIDDDDRQSLDSVAVGKIRAQQEDAANRTNQTIQFDDDIRPARSRVPHMNSSGVDLDHGVMFSRTVSMGRRSIRARSFDRRSRRSSQHEDDDIEDPDADLRRPTDFKQKQVFSGWQMMLLAYQSLGVIYGDIGTSPLYVYSSTFAYIGHEPTMEDYVGVLSLVIWSLLMMVTLKYVVIILRADNDGEGGTFSCFSLISRYANIGNRDPREGQMIRINRYDTGDIGMAGRAVRSTLERSKILTGVLRTMAVFAVSMVMSDGVLTPAQSVLGAIQGLTVVKQDISNSIIVGVTCAILILLFLIQPFGTGKIGSTFAPIIIIWFLFNAGFGIYNLANYDYTVLRAFNPGQAFIYLIRNKENGWRSLGGVLLAFTGVEALFADLGAFSMQAIQLSWLCYTLPCLLLSYCGQVAYMAEHPGAWENPFYNSAPHGWLIPSIVIAVLAAIVASQAIITATFQLLAQITKFSYFPHIEIKHTSTSHHGQLYVPLANYLLCIGTVAVTAAFNNTTSLGNAYGVCVMFVTFFDTSMTALASIIVWKIPPYFVALPWLAIACMDGAFLSSALTKVPSGAWFTITLAAVLAGLFILWRYGKEQQWKAEAEDRQPTSHFVRPDKADGGVKLTRNYGGEKLSVVKGFGIFFDKSGESAPIVFSQFIRKLTAVPEVMVFFHMRPLETPTVSYDQQFTVRPLALPNCYRVVLRHGYMDQIMTPALANDIYKEVRVFVEAETHPVPPPPMVSNDDNKTPVSHEHSAIDSSEKTSSDDSKPEKTADESVNPEAEADFQAVPLSVLQLDQAYQHRVLYIVGKEEMHIKTGTPWYRRALLSAFLFIRHNTRPKMANMQVPADKLVEIGFVKEV